LDALVKDHRLTPDGRDWLTLALDPFHDQNHPAAGYPDADGSQTIVSCYQYQLDVTAPVGAVGNWDCHVFFNPLSTTANGLVVDQAATWATLTEPAAASPYPLGPLSIVSADAGGALVPINPLPAVYRYQCLPAVGTTDISAGVSRVIGAGYEVVNTTAEINKQGAVTSYRMPQYKSDVGSILWKNAANTVNASMSAVRYRQAPANVAQANLLKGTRTWDASAGVYATMAQSAISNPLTVSNSVTPIFDTASVPGATSQVLSAGYNWIQLPAAPSATLGSGFQSKHIPFDTTGSMFTGLSNSTTLTVKLRLYVERAPTFAEPNLSVLATPSAGYDPVALELYSHAISHLPVAVTVHENGAGDWFRAVVRTLKDAAGPLTTFFSHFVPGATVVGSAAQQILGQMDSWAHPSHPRPSVSASGPPQHPTIHPTATPPKKKKPRRVTRTVSVVSGRRRATK